MNKYPGWRSLDLNNAELTDLNKEQTGDIPPSFLTTPPQTIGQFYQDCYQNFLDTNQKNVAQQFSSLFLRHLTIAWGGPIPQGQRISPREQQSALVFLDTLNVSELKNSLKVLEAYFETNPLSGNIKSVLRNHLNKSLNIAIKARIINPERTEIFYRIKEKKKSRLYPQDIKLMENRPSWADRNILGMLDSDFVHGEPTIPKQRTFPNWQLGISLWCRCPNLLVAICAVDFYHSTPSLYLGSPELDKELCNFFEFLIQRLNHREVTAQRDFLAILRYLAWLQHQKEVPLAELQITQVIPFIKLKFKRQDFKNEFGVVNAEKLQLAKIMAVEDMEEATEQIISNFDEYLESRRISWKSKINYMKSFVNLAKYVYQRETTDFKAERGFKDIPLIQRLRQTNHEFDQKSRNAPKLVIAREKRMIPWLEVLAVVEKLRTEALLTHRFHIRSNRCNSNGEYKIDKVKRTEFARACDFQQFLLMAIYTAMPPGRPREYYELDIGRTFVAGELKDGIFIPREQMRNPDQAVWWMHLMPQDYKTGRKYQEWWGKISNIKYSDGTRLYDYIDEWLTKWRLVFQPTHNRFFTTEKGKEIRGNAFAGRVQRSICRFTGARVNPHSLRHIFVTYLRSIGASEEALNSAARAMHHSRETQASIYDLQDLQAALEPSLNLAQQIAESYFANYQNDYQ